jgi:serine/threonine protein kinase
MLPVPEKIDRYLIKDTLGKGAMGVVYKALDPTIDRVVAVKAIHENEFRANPDGEEMEARFRREIHTAGLLTHANIVTVYDGGKDDNIHWIAMEYVDGPSLSALIKENHRIPVQATLDLVTKVCDAIDFAHRKNIIHRDLKPGNILLSTDGEPKLADFGIARIDSSTMTQTGVILGTPSYMSPEQVKGKSIDHRSDQFSLGIILYEMLTGRRPFRGDSPTSIMYQIVHEEIRPPHVLNKEVPVALSRIVMRALAKRPVDRYESAADMARDLKKLRDGADLETTLRELDSALETAEIKKVPDLDTLSNLQAEEENGLSGLAKFVIFLLVLAAITAGAYYAYLFFSDSNNSAEIDTPDRPPVEQAVVDTKLVVTTGVEGATVYLDGVEAGPADGTSIPISGPVGQEKQFEVRAECHQTFSGTFTISDTEAVKQTVQLQKLQKEISITTNPEGAELFLNDESIGTAPLKHSFACGEEIKLEARLPGFHQSSQTLSWQELESEEEVGLNLREIEKGIVAVDAPYPVNLTTSEGKSLSLENGKVELMPGTYNIRLTNSEYFLNTNRTVTLSEGGSARIDDLPALGELWIREMPVYNGIATIRGFNRELQLPVLQQPIVAGKFTVVIRWPDGEEMEHKIDVKPGRNQPCELNVRKGTR